MTIQGLLAQEDVGNFRNALAQLIYQEIIQKSYQDTAPVSTLGDALEKISCAVNTALNSLFRDGTQSMQFYLHLLHSRQELTDTVSSLQRQIADENPVDTAALPQLLDAILLGIRLKLEPPRSYDRKDLVTA